MSKISIFDCIMRYMFLCNNDSNKKVVAFDDICYFVKRVKTIFPSISYFDPSGKGDVIPSDKREFEKIFLEKWSKISDKIDANSLIIETRQVCRPDSNVCGFYRTMRSDFTSSDFVNLIINKDKKTVSPYYRNMDSPEVKSLDSIIMDILGNYSRIGPDEIYKTYCI